MKNAIKWFWGSFFHISHGLNSLPGNCAVCMLMLHMLCRYVLAEKGFLFEHDFVSVDNIVLHCCFVTSALETKNIKTVEKGSE